MVKALTSHQCGPGVILYLAPYCTSLLLILYLLQEVLSGHSSFSLSSKTNVSKFQFKLESEGHRIVSASVVKQSQFINICIKFFTGAHIF